MRPRKARASVCLWALHVSCSGSRVYYVLVFCCCCKLQPRPCLCVACQHHASRQGCCRGRGATRTSHATHATQAAQATQATHSTHATHATRTSHATCTSHATHATHASRQGVVPLWATLRHARLHAQHAGARQDGYPSAGRHGRSVQLCYLAAGPAPTGR